MLRDAVEIAVVSVLNQSMNQIEIESFDKLLSKGIKVRKAHQNSHAAFLILEKAVALAEQAEDQVRVIIALGEMCACIENTAERPELFHRYYRLSESHREQEPLLFCNAAYQLSRLRRAQGLSSQASQLLDMVLPDLDNVNTESVNHLQVLLHCLSSRRELALQEGNAEVSKACTMRSIKVGYQISCIQGQAKSDAEESCEIIIAADMITRENVVRISKETRQWDGNLLDEIVALGLIDRVVIDAARSLTQQMKAGLRDRARAITLLNYVDGKRCSLEKAMTDLDMPLRPPKT